MATQHLAIDGGYQPYYQIYQQLNSSNMNIIAGVIELERSPQYLSLSNTKKLLNHIKAKNNNQRLQNILTKLNDKNSSYKHGGSHRKANSLLTNQVSYLDSHSGQNSSRDREPYKGKAVLNTLSKLENERRLNLLNLHISNMPLLPQDYSNSYQEESAQRLNKDLQNTFDNNSSQQDKSETTHQKPLKEMFQVKPIKLKDKNEMYQEMKVKSELALQYIKQVQVIDIGDFRSKASLRSKKYTNDREIDSNAHLNLHNQKLKELLKDNSIAHLEQAYFEGSTDPSSQKQSMHHSTNLLKLQGGVTPSLQNYNPNDLTQGNPSTERLPQPTKRSLSTLRSVNRYDHHLNGLGSQLSGPRALGEQSGEVVLKKSILRFPQFRQSLMTIEQNQEPNGDSDFKQQDHLNQFNEKHFSTFNQQTIQQNQSNTSLENLSQENRSRKHLPKNPSSKKKFTLDQKRFNELKRQQQKIQELMRNNYFYNNFALLPNQNPAFSKLKTRFPLFEMVVQDDDFMERLKNRKQDVLTLQESLHKHVYNDQEIKIRHQRIRERNKSLNLQ